jgi:hypothetical protein
MEFRRIRLAEVDAVTDLAVEALATYSSHVPLHVDRTKIRTLVNTFCVHREHFHQVAFEQGVPVAALALYVSEIPFYERSEGHVMICYARRAGACLPLIHSMMRWVRDDMRVRRVQWAMNEHSTAVGRLCAMLQRRWGFDRRFDNLVYYKGGA